MCSIGSSQKHVTAQIFILSHHVQARHECSCYLRQITGNRMIGRCKQKRRKIPGHWFKMCRFTFGSHINWNKQTLLVLNNHRIYTDTIAEKHVCQIYIHWNSWRHAGGTQTVLVQTDTINQPQNTTSPHNVLVNNIFVIF